QHGGLVWAAGVGLFEAEARRARTGFRFEVQRAGAERTRDDPVPAVREQDRDDPAGGNVIAVHTAAAFRLSECRGRGVTPSASSRSSAAISLWPLPSASDSGVPPHRSTGWGSAPTASR